MRLSNLAKGTRYVPSLSSPPQAGSTGKEDCEVLCLGNCPSQVEVPTFHNKRQCRTLDHQGHESIRGSTQKDAQAPGEERSPARGQKTDKQGAFKLGSTLWVVFSFRLLTRGLVPFKLPGGRGHHIPAPTWEGCRATLSVLLSCSAVPGGGCRSSWRLCSWRWCFSLACGFGVSFRFLLRGRRPEDRFSSAGTPSMFYRVGGPLGCERRDGSDGWRSPVPRGDNTGRRDCVHPPPTIASQARRQVLKVVTDLRWTVYGMADPVLPDGCDVAASFLTRCRGSRIFVYVAAATSASCRGTSQQDISFQMSLQLQTLRRHLSRLVAAGVFGFLGPMNFFESDFRSPCYRGCCSRCRLH